MSYHKYAKQQYDQPKEKLDELWQERLIQWRKDQKVERVSQPTRVPKARQLGYKAKGGYIVSRVKIKRGGTKRKRPKNGRKPSSAGQTRYSPKKSKQVIAEQKASRHFENLEVLNSYWVAEDGEQKWYEVLLVDPDHPQIKSDDNINWITDNRNRAERGLTPASKESRGLQQKGKGSEKVRPSQNANNNQGK